jgi:hypothetical protein
VTRVAVAGASKDSRSFTKEGERYLVFGTIFPGRRFGGVAMFVEGSRGGVLSRFDDGGRGGVHLEKMTLEQAADHVSDELGIPLP